MRCAQSRLPTVAAFALVLLTTPLLASAVEIFSDEEGEQSVSLDGAFKATSLLSYAPDDRLLFPERESAVGLFRFRLGLNAQLNEWINSEIAYEHRARIVSEDAGISAGGGILPSEAEAPYRISQLDWQLAEHDSTFSYRHELDRAFVALHPDWGEITIGRQAIGLGRGVLFGAVDIFAPFSPLKVDREWRRGVDAARVEYRVSDTSSAELLAAFGESWDESALLGRVRGYIGNVDGELIIGKRAEDIMYAGAMSAAVAGAEVHLELALFDTEEAHPDGGLFGNNHLIGKAVLGSSYTFDVGDGLTLLGEYHYSGFGVEDIEDAIARLMDPVFQERFLRGDTQILGQHALAVSCTYPINDAWNGAVMVLQSPVDGSGVASPALMWDATENVSLVLNAFIPWGARPSGGQLKSEYGGTPISLFLQFSTYF